MLYITTNDQKDANTAYRTLVDNKSADGGVYIPFRLPFYDCNQIKELCRQSFAETVAQILNYFFSSKLTGWDVDFAIGRNPVKIVTTGHKIIVSELWHNYENSYGCLVRNLFRILTNNEGVSTIPTDWAKIAIRIAMLFGIYGELQRNEATSNFNRIDVVINVGEYFEPIAAVYAREMGLPLGKIIVCCNDDNSLAWDLIHKNEIPTTSITEELKLGISRLLYCVYGADEVKVFAEAYAAGSIYSVDTEQLPRLSDTLFCVVVSNSRLGSVINSILNTDKYHISERTAMAFGAIQDYRSRAGERTLTLVMAEDRPS